VAVVQHVAERIVAHLVNETAELKIFEKGHHRSSLPQA
jgi:hypothetical protein